MAKLIPLFLLFLIASALITQSKASVLNSRGEKGGDEKEKSDAASDEPAEPVERAIGITGLTSRWDAVRTWARLAWYKMSPESRYGNSGASTPSGKVTEATTESIKMAKGAMKQAAESAAEVTDEAARAAKKKLKRTMSIHPSHKKNPSDDEL